MKKKIFGILTLIFLTAVFSIVFKFSLWKQTPINVNTNIVFDLAQGDSASKVARKLIDEQYFECLWCFKLAFKQYPELIDIKPGRYLLTEKMSVFDVFRKFVSNDQIKYQVTLVEGLTIKELLTKLNENEQLRQSEIMLSPNSLVEQAWYSWPHYEGGLFADTYTHFYKDTLMSIAKRAHVRLLQVLEEEWNDRSPNLPINSPYEALILASIIEKETAVAAERAKIAGVFIRRLQKGMRLQTDPTVIYGVGESYAGDITRKHLKTDTPYNTYTRGGLPPTPIAIVGRESIHAALNPEEGSALYFVAKGDGSHQFSDTLEQHNKAVKQFILNKK